MTLKLSGKERIHNFRNYPAGTVADLRATLAAGAAAEPDPRRHAFYDVTSGSRKYYIHLAPDGSVWLLASWIERCPVAAEASAMLTACV